MTTALGRLGMISTHADYHGQDYSLFEEVGNLSRNEGFWGLYRGPTSAISVHNYTALGFADSAANRVQKVARWKSQRPYF